MTLKDETLTHQVRFSTTQKGKIKLSCNCRMAPGLHKKAGKFHASPIGESKNLEEARKLYNDPENHWAPFTEEDKAKW